MSTRPGDHEHRAAVVLVSRPFYSFDRDKESVYFGKANPDADEDKDEMVTLPQVEEHANDSEDSWEFEETEDA